MARIAGVDLPREKRVEIGLTYIYGIGLTTSQKMLAEVGVNPDTRVKDLSETEISKLRECLSISNASSKSAAIAAFVTVTACPFADRTRSRTPARAKVPRRPSPARRKRPSNFEEEIKNGT